MKKLFTILTGTFFCFGVTLLVPFAGEGSGISPISSAWAAPNCDADGDGHLKNNRKCGGDDPDDSNPCDPDPEAAACGGGSGGGGGSTGPDYYNLARASFATRGELGNPDGGVFADDVGYCGPFDYWDWQDTLILDENPSDTNCITYKNSSNISGGGRWFLISSPAGSEEVLDVIERWLVVDFTDSRSDSPCYDLDFGAEGYAQYGIPLYRDDVRSQSGGLVDQIEKNVLPCVDNLAIRLSADRILKAKANQQQLEFSIRWRPDPAASIYWSPWGYVSYIQPLYLRNPSSGDPQAWLDAGCRVMSTRPAPGADHDRAEAELLLKTGAGQTEVLGSYNLPLEVCVNRASE
jgi:hypothetical protein